MAAKQEPVYNAAGTHVWIYNPETGGLWECPVAAAEVYVGEPGPGVRGGWEYAAAPDDSLEGVADEAPAPAKKSAAKKSASKSSSTSGD